MIRDLTKKIRTVRRFAEDNVIEKNLTKDLSIADTHKILLVLALGYPAEKVVVEDVGMDDNVRYWRDRKDVHHVLKRKLEDILYPPCEMTSASNPED